MLLKLKHHFDAAHRLSNYDGKCRNLHGHRWNVEIEIVGEPDDSGMIVDFSWIKKEIDVYDHCALLQLCTENAILIKALQHSNCKLQTLVFEPTAENLACLIYIQLIDKLPQGCKLTVKLWESPDACIEYNGE